VKHFPEAVTTVVEFVGYITILYQLLMLFSNEWEEKTICTLDWKRPYKGEVVVYFKVLSRYSLKE
jgi:hypothetical protein